MVLNKDPDYDYHFWAEADTAHGLTEAQAMGWEPVERKDDPHAERLQGGTTAKTVGEWIRSRGLVLCRRHKDDESAVLERERKDAFTGQLAQDLGIGNGTAQQRWNRGRIMGRPAWDMDPTIEEKVSIGRRQEVSEANPYPAQPQE